MPSDAAPDAVGDDGSPEGEPEMFDGQKTNDAKGKGKAVAVIQDYPQSETQLFAYTDEPPTGKAKKSVRRKNRTANVTLLQTTLRSSQIEKAGKRMRLPVSGHWAIEIRGEVFELNRMESWTWRFTLRPEAETDYPKWVGKAFATVYISVLQSLSSFFRLRPQAGSRAQIDTCSYGEYLALREKWTEPLLLGTTTASQKWIKRCSKWPDSHRQPLSCSTFAKELVTERNKVVMFYSIFSNNCQHFILDLCEHIELQPSVTSNSANSVTNDEVDTEFIREYTPNRAEKQDINIQHLWMKSRLVFLIGFSLHFLLSFVLPFITIIVSRLGEAVGNKPLLLVLLALPFYGFVAWLSFSDIIVGHEELPVTMDGSPYLHSTCYTGSDMRRLLLASSNHYYCSLIRFLLRMEKLPYKLSLLLGYMFAMPVVIAQIDVPSLYLDTRMSRFNRQRWAVMQAVFLLMFILGHGYDMVLQRRKLRQAEIQEQDIIEHEEAEWLEEQVNLIELQYEGTEEQNQVGESSRSQLG